MYRLVLGTVVTYPLSLRNFLSRKESEQERRNAVTLKCSAWNYLPVNICGRD